MGRNMSKVKTFRALAIAGLLSAGVWSSTFATFTDSATGSASFTAGTVDLELADEADDVYAFTSLDVTNMAPGGVQYAKLKIENAGSLAYSYSMATTATNTDAKGLAAVLNAGVALIGAADTCNAANYAAAVTATNVLATEGVGLANLAISSRTLAAAASSYGCFKVELPSGTGDAYQAAATTATFTFSATQA